MQLTLGLVSCGLYCLVPAVTPAGSDHFTRHLGKTLQREEIKLMFDKSNKCFDWLIYLFPQG